MNEMATSHDARSGPARGQVGTLEEMVGLNRIHAWSLPHSGPRWFDRRSVPGAVLTGLKSADTLSHGSTLPFDERNR